LANTNLSTGARHQAALQFKNALRNVTQISELNNVWDRVDPEMKVEIRNKILGTLADDEMSLRMAAALAVAAIAELDIPHGQWPDLIDILVKNAASPQKEIKHASLMTLGYICEAIPPSTVSPETSSQILTAIVNGILPEEDDPHVKLVAAEALINSLKFIAPTIQIDE
jgi:importin subunit beta-1